jgi:hypothetical protein
MRSTSSSRAAVQAALFIALMFGASPDAPRAQSAAPAPAAIGIVCRDGTFVPIGSLGVPGWRSLTQAEDRIDQYFGRVTDVGRRLPRQGWILHPHDGSSPRPFSLLAPPPVAKDVFAGCVDVEPFSTDVPRVAGHPNDELGFGVLGGGTIEALEDVTTQPDAASRLLAQWFVRRVQSEEPRLLAPENQYITKPSLEEQQRTVVRLTHLVRRTSDGVALYYGEAEKQYGPNGTLVLVQAWVSQSPRGITTLRRESILENGDRKLTMRRARVLVRFGEREFWLMREHGYEDHEVSVFDVTGRPRRVASLTISAS